MKIVTQEKCCEELRHINIYISSFIEGIGLAILVFISGCEIVKIDIEKGIHITEAAFVSGFTLAILTQCLKDISGGHLNPAISIACVCTKRISLFRCFSYIIFQCGGGILGALMLREMVPHASTKNLALTSLSNDISLSRGIGFEMIFMFVYTLVFFASTSSKNTFKGFGGPLAIGIFYAISHMILLPITGCSLNPARSLGPAVLIPNFENHWIYWAAPILSSCFGGLLHDLLFKPARNKRHQRERSCSILCCKPSDEEAMYSHNHKFDSDTDLFYHDAIVRRPSEDV